MEKFKKHTQMKIFGGKSGFLTVILLLTLPLLSCGQKEGKPKKNQEPTLEQTPSPNQNPGTFHYRSEIWQNGERKIIDTTLTLGSGMNGFFQFGDSLLGGNGFNFQMPDGGMGFNFSFPGDGNGFFSDSLFSSPFHFGAPGDMMKMFEDQRKMMEDLFRQMPHNFPMPPPQKPKGPNEEEIIDL